ncbi:AraC family transcriptional regulator [Roseiarcaceae bacterium H3SJ34-1]|uniref:helix-turn-helix transcriptional regulator n=1 Tax=Terripilifer ovatus TaxID=3032367 RepID=UPI003AB9B3CC|nr:AraC family transcriptional regulator [Roseiarcaceae bacterium H3SJ34-1]
MSVGFSASWNAHTKRIDFGDASVEIVRTTTLKRHVFAYGGECAYLAIGLSGERRSGETRTRAFTSSHRSLGGCLFALPRGENMEGWSEPETKSSWLNIYLHEKYRLSDPDLTIDALLNRPHLAANAYDAMSFGRKMERLIEARSASLPTYLQSFVTLLLLANEDIGSETGAGAARELGPLGRSKVKQLDSYIARHETQQIAVADMARIVDMSLSGFIRAFRRTYGHTPHRYLQLRKLALAKTMLRDGEMSLTDIALDAGFASSSHFAAAFRARFGITPSAYRLRVHTAK